MEAAGSRVVRAAWAVLLLLLLPLALADMKFMPPTGGGRRPKKPKHRGDSVGAAIQKQVRRSVTRWWARAARP